MDVERGARLEDATGLQRVRVDAERRGVRFEIRSRPAARSLEEAAALLGLEPREIVKTLVVKRRDDEFVFALVPGDRQLSWPKFRTLLGANRLKLADPEDALRATGYERGAITPFGSTTDWPVYADASMSGRVAMGAGEHGYDVFVESADVIRAFGARVADITQ